MSHRPLIEAYLKGMQASDTAVVGPLSAPGATLEYPGGRRFTALETLFAWATGRHRWVEHRIEHFDEVPAPGADVVYVTGVLRGEWMSGAPFDDIRFIYRFVVVQGRVAETRLWSDVAERLRRDAEVLA